MANKRTTLYLSGKLYWAKVFGNPRPNYDGDAREWTFEFEPDEDSVEQLEELGLDDRLRDRSDKKGYEGRGKFIILKRKEFKVDGEKNEHIRVVDAANQNWDSNKLLGNGTTADVKVTVVDYGPRKKEGIYPVAIRVLDLVEYQQDEFAPLSDDDPRKKAAKAKRQVTDDQFNKDFGIEEEEEEEPAPKPKRAKAKRIPDEDLDDDVPF